MVVQDDAIVLAQVERVLNSDKFRNAEVLRRLLKFLADKSIAGEAEQLKEYTVAVDCLGKPPSYDPRQDSLVRIQIGRLRTKLSEYYQSEGEQDSVVLEIPKGHFKLVWETKPLADTPIGQVALPRSKLTASWWIALGLRSQLLAVAILALWGLAATILFWREHQYSAPLREAWTLEIQELWKPFAESERQLILAVSSPLFVGFQGSGFYRDQSLNDWNDVLISPKVQAIRKALNNPEILQRHYYTGLGEVQAAVRLAKLLDYSGTKISTTRSNLVSWQQIVDHNILFVGPPRVFGDALHKLPVDLDLVMHEDGIHDRKAAPNHGLIFADNYPSISANQSSIPDSGEVFALVSRVPGPLGSGNVMSFSSNHSPGVQGAVEFFTDPNFARQLITKLRKPDGKIPLFFQVVLKVGYRDAIPTEISYITHREVLPGSKSNVR